MLLQKLNLVISIRSTAVNFLPWKVTKDKREKCLCQSLTSMAALITKLQVPKCSINSNGGLPKWPPRKWICTLGRVKTILTEGCRTFPQSLQYTSGTATTASFHVTTEPPIKIISLCQSPVNNPYSLNTIVK
jgi:hypothetical protein